MSSVNLQGLHRIRLDKVVEEASSREAFQSSSVRYPGYKQHHLSVAERVGSLLESSFSIAWPPFLVIFFKPECCPPQVSENFKIPFLLKLATMGSAVYN